MKTASLLIVGVYGISAAIALLVGHLFSDLNEWSHWILGACGGHAILSLIIAGSPMADGGRIAAWFWHSISTLIGSVLLLIYALHSIWIVLIAAATLGGITIIATLAFLILLKIPITKSKS